MESLDADVMLAKSCGAIGAGLKKLMIEHERASVEWFARIQFRKRMVIGYYNGRVMYENMYCDMDWD